MINRVTTPGSILPQLPDVCTLIQINYKHYIFFSCGYNRSEPLLIISTVNLLTWSVCIFNYIGIKKENRNTFFLRFLHVGHKNWILLKNLLKSDHGSLQKWVKKRDEHI